MCYKILANKWRPKIFSDVIGQDHIVQSLINSLSKKHTHHAYIFSGPKGVGKTTIARLLAKGLNCKKNISNIPCGQCNHCIEIEQNRFIDLIEIDAASRTKVEDMRELLDTVQYLPTKGFYKIYLIDEVHMLSKYSFNALLKTLEEPPKHIKFFLATTESQKLPETIVSRCFHLHLKQIKTELICKRLKFILDKENISVENEAIKLLACSAHGSMRDALTLTDQVIAINNKLINTKDVKSIIGYFDKDKVLDIFECITNGNGEKMMILINQISLNNPKWDDLLIEILKILHRISILQILKNDNQLLETNYEKRLLNFSQNVPVEDIQLYYQTFINGRKDLNLAPNTRMGLEITLLRALVFYPKIHNVNEFNKEKINNNFIELSSKNIDITKIHEILQKNLKKDQIKIDNEKKNIDVKKSITYDINNILKKIELKNNVNIEKNKQTTENDFIEEAKKLFNAKIDEENII